MTARCTKCRRPLKGEISRRTLVKATAARLRGCVVTWACKEKMPDGSTCGGMIQDVEELVNPFTIDGPVKLFAPPKETIIVR